MSKLQDLINEFCPNGVEYKKLGEIATISRGGNLQKKDFTEDGVPCIHYGQIYTRYGLFADTTFSFISEESGKRQKYAEPTDIIMAVTSENIEDVCKCVAWLGNEPVAVSGHTAIIHHNQNPRYMCYYFHSSDFQAQKNRLAHGTKVMEVTPSKLADIVLPVPPLPIQREIVRILDNFTELTAELQEKLTAELTARKKQYEYYSSKLFVDSIHNWMPMSELAEFVYGYTDKANDTGDTRFIRITDINEQGCLNKQNPKYITLNDEAKKSLLSKGDLIMARTGATFGKTLYFDSDEQSVYASFLIKIIPNKQKLDNRFYWHFTKTPLYWEQANKLVSAGGQPQFNTPALKQVKVPVPSLEEQHRIVSILDRFDALCNDLTSGLPAEIEARQKQYEYYRDKLLRFKEL